MPTTLFEKGDAVRGERLAMDARRLSKISRVNQSGRHKAQYITAHDSAFCVIEMPLKARPKLLS